MRRATTLATITLLLAAFLAPVARAADRPAAEARPATLSLTVSAAPQNRVLLSAQLAGADGRPLSNREVHFYLQTSFFADRMMLLGSGITDTAGAVSQLFEPTWTGPHRFQVTFEGGEGYQPASTEATFDVSGLRKPAPTAAEPAGIPLVRQGTGLLALAMTAVVWAMLLLVVVRVGLGLSRVQAEPDRHAGVWTRRRALSTRRG